MAAYDNIVLPEQTSLIGAGPGDPFFGGRLEDDDPVAGLGDAFVLNSQVTSTPTNTSGLIPADAVRGIGSWLRGLLAQGGDDLLDVSDERAEDAPVLTTSDLGRRVGLDLETLPEPYEAWRFSIELYVLHGRSIYEVRNDLAVRSKVLTEDELGIAHSQRLLPFQSDDTDALAFVVALLPRTAALAGLRGQRRALLAAGEAKAELARLATSDYWRWETEFYDDAATRVLSVDGVERVPLVVGCLTEQETT